MNGERVGKWPTIANQKREDAIAHFLTIEQNALSSLEAAKRRQDYQDAVRQAESALHARGGRLELIEARYLGRQ